MNKKLLYTTLLYALGFTSYAQNVNIPDVNFKSYLVGNSAINTNSDAEIQVSEAAAFTGTINCTNDGISDLTGIEAFTALTTLYCEDNSLTSIDVTNNTALLDLRCSNNALTALDVSNNTALTKLLCHANSLTTLDVSNNVDLTFLHCGSNSLSSLDVSNNTALTVLNCGYNSITSLDLSNNTALTDLGCASNSLTALNVLNNTELVSFFCHDNAITSLNVSNNTVLEEMICHNNSLTTIDITSNPNLTQLRCDNNPLTVLNAANGNNTNIIFFYTLNTPNLTCIQVDDVAYSTANWTDIDPASNFSLGCGYPVYIPDANFKAYLVGNSSINTNSDAEIQVSEAATYTGIISCQSLNISDLTGIEAFTSATALYCSTNNLSSLDLSNNTALTILYCNENSLTSLDLSNNINLTEVFCQINNLTDINLDNLTSLTRLICRNNNLTSLDISSNVNLTELQCGVNNLTSLNLSNNTNLLYTYVNNNNLSALDVANNVGLVRLDFYYNSISSLDLSNCPDLEVLWGFGNSLNSLNVANGNNTNFSNATSFRVNGNPNLTCIQVDDVAYSTTNWTSIDATASFSTDCGVSSTYDEYLSNMINIYPNPSTSMIHIDTEVNITSIAIIDMLGETIAVPAASQNQIEVSELTNGIYTLQIKTDAGIASKKFYKE